METLQFNQWPMIKYLLPVLLVIYSPLFSQTRMSLEECEKSFTTSNLQLLAQHYNISYAEALAQQARIWNLPYLQGEFNMADPQNSKAFNMGSKGQKALSVQQLIYLGGKKRKEVALADKNVKVAALEFQELLHDLQYQLHTSFFRIYFSRKNIEAIDKQVSGLDSLIHRYTEQVNKGNIPLRDLIRLQTLQLSLVNERLTHVNELTEEQSNMSLLTGNTALIEPAPTNAELLPYFDQKDFTVEALQEQAIANKVVLKKYDRLKDAALLDESYQKSLAVPDLTLGAAYDQNGGAFKNQVNLTFGIPLKFWNVNKGNIKASQVRALQVGTEAGYAQQAIKTSVESALNKYKASLQNYLQARVVEGKAFEDVYNGIFQNFQKRNISLIEFTDFMESYHQTTVQNNNSRKQLVLSGEELNYVTGTKLF